MSYREYDQAAGARRYRMLRKLKIDSVDSVDAGANPHAKVIFTKRRDTMTETVDVLKGVGGGIVHAATAVIAKAEAGELDEHQLGEFQKVLALTMYPDAPNEGVALAKLFGTAIGKRLLNASVHAKRPDYAAHVAKVRAGEENPRGERTTSTRAASQFEEDDEPGDSPHISPPYKAPMALGEKHRATPEGKGKSVAQAFTHCAVETDEGCKLLAQDKQWHSNRMRSHRAQAAAAVSP